MSRTASIYLFAAVLLVSPRWAAAQQGAPAGHWEGSFTGPNGGTKPAIDAVLTMWPCRTCARR